MSTQPRTAEQIRASIAANQSALATSLTELRGEVVAIADWRRADQPQPAEGPRRRRGRGLRDRRRHRRDHRPPPALGARYCRRLGGQRADAEHARARVGRRSRARSPRRTAGRCRRSRGRPRRAARRRRGPGCAGRTTRSPRRRCARAGSRRMPLERAAARAHALDRLDVPSSNERIGLIFSALPIHACARRCARRGAGTRACRARTRPPCASIASRARCGDLLDVGRRASAAACAASTTTPSPPHVLLRVDDLDPALGRPSSRGRLARRLDRARRCRRRGGSRRCRAPRRPAARRPRGSRRSTAARSSGSSAEVRRPS